MPTLSLEERIAISEEKLRAFSKIEENIIKHINFQLVPIQHDLEQIKRKIYNGWDDQIKENTKFREGHMKEQSEGKKTKKDFWLIFIRSVMVSVTVSAILGLSTLFIFLLKNHEAILQYINRLPK